LDRGSGFYVPFGPEPVGGIQNLGNTDGGWINDFANNRRALLVRNNHRPIRPWFLILTSQLLVGINALIRFARNTFGASDCTSVRYHLYLIGASRPAWIARKIQVFTKDLKGFIQ